MQFIYDDLTATIVAMTTMLLLFSIQSRATQDNVARTSRNMMKTQAQTFATWIEKDLQRIGKNIDQDERKDQSPFDNPVKRQMEGGTRLTEQFTFYRDRVVGNGETRIATRYEVGKTQQDPARFQLTRKTKEVGTGTWAGATVDGESSASLGYFQIDMLDDDARPVSNPSSNLDRVHSIRVRFSVAAPFKSDESILDATHVGSVLLIRNDNPGKESEIQYPQNKGDCQGGGWKELRRPGGGGFSCAAACIYVATGGSQGSDKCNNNGGGDDGGNQSLFCRLFPFWCD